MLYALFIFVLVAVIFAVVWLGVLSKKAATGETEKLEEPDDTRAP